MQRVRVRTERRKAGMNDVASSAGAYQFGDCATKHGSTRRQFFAIALSAYERTAVEKHSR